MSRIVLAPSGGLGNRMKAISAAVRLATDCHSGLLIVWHRDWGMGCRFSQLFKPLDFDCVRIKEASPIDRFTLDEPRRSNLYLPKLYLALNHYTTMSEATVTRNMHAGFDFKQWAEGRNIFLRSCVYFLSEAIPADAFSIFSPIDEVMRGVGSICKNFSKHTVGVHIRRTDNRLSIEHSPTDMFVSRMKQEPADTMFYLATDSEEVKQELKQAFGGRIITSAAKADRGSAEGIKEALAEMYALSRTSHILGSAFSTFSQAAAAIGGISCETIKKP